MRMIEIYVAKQNTLKRILIKNNSPNEVKICLEPPRTDRFRLEFVNNDFAQCQNGYAGRIEKLGCLVFCVIFLVPVKLDKVNCNYRDVVRVFSAFSVCEIRLEAHAEENAKVFVPKSLDDSSGPVATFFETGKENKNKRKEVIEMV